MAATSLDSVKTLFRPPQSCSWRTAEHLLAIGVTVYVAGRAIQLGPRGVMKSVLGSLLRAGQIVPGVAGIIDSAQEEALQSVRDDILGDGDENANVELPAHGKRCVLPHTASMDRVVR